jgi:NAD(P)-dependent dehydrogenase (short-subunit alcohol dehydrogenase family)
MRKLQMVHAHLKADHQFLQTFKNFDMDHNQPMLREGALKDRVILVTGGGTGLGKSMTAAFLQLGASVIIASRKMENLEKTAGEFNADFPGKVLPLPCDIRDYAQVEETIQKGIQHYGKIDTLVNNAAGNFISPTERLSHRAFDTVVDIVLKGSYNCTLAMGKYWIEEKIKGNVLSITTTYTFTGSAYVVPSACGKAGVLALTQSLAVEWARHGIRLNAIAPGPFPTKGAWSRLFPDKIKSLFEPSKKVPLGRFGEHRELANLACYLISDYASFVTGEQIVIDGGEWLKGAGQFNFLTSVPDEQWDELERIVRKGRSE